MLTVADGSAARTKIRRRRYRLKNLQPVARETPSASRRAPTTQAARDRTFRSSRRISPSMCCRPIRFASIPRTGNSSCMASSIAPSPRAIGKGGKSFPELVRELSTGFSPRQDRGGSQAAGGPRLYRAGIAGFRRPPSPAIGRASACRPESRRKISRAAASRVESIDVKGANEFSAALSELGVRVVNRSPDLTVMLVNDYLERRLAELNRAARRGQDPLAAGAALRRLSAGRTGVQAGRRRLLDLPVRSHDPKPRGQGISRPRRRRAPSRSRRWSATRFGQSAIQFAALESPKRSPPAFAPI